MIPKELKEGLKGMHISKSFMIHEALCICKLVAVIVHFKKMGYKLNFIGSFSKMETIQLA